MHGGSRGPSLVPRGSIGLEGARCAVHEELALVHGPSAGDTWRLLVGGLTRRSPLARAAGVVNQGGPRGGLGLAGPRNWACTESSGFSLDTWRAGSGWSTDARPRDVRGAPWTPPGHVSLARWRA